MTLQEPITDLMRRRYSCRNYQPVPVPPEKRAALTDFIEHLPPGPFGAPDRYLLADAGGGFDLRRMGTYGFIKNPPAFIIGALQPAEKNLENFGYRMQLILLAATGLGLGTCWLGGTFTRGSFARAVQAQPGEIIPAVASVGLAQTEGTLINSLARQSAQSDRRLPWEALFFDGQFGVPLARAAADHSLPLEMLRIAPSASNKQPWRVVKDGRAWHFYIQRTPGYRSNLGLNQVLRIADMQRVDIGIAMCHFENSARAAGLAGHWLVQDPALPLPDALTEYSASWIDD